MNQEKTHEPQPEEGVRDDEVRGTPNAERLYDENEPEVLPSDPDITADDYTNLPG
ncbi:hypothetical protein [Pseudomonas oligotrophica]|uniref:hypothetical protein n=1 Tax=Pseudomonas oligotrophica TaxID=2912055 RepID=UPI001F35D831|nr:hypothetical protein [Pseudomonas oligotrophica]MCF7203243.1 hypothetical protein [Pseudomonas oligotrophica]